MGFFLSFVAIIVVILLLEATAFIWALNVLLPLRLTFDFWTYVAAIVVIVIFGSNTSGSGS